MIELKRIKRSEASMKIDKVINNNVVSVINEQRKELVIMGRGIGFQKKPGQCIDKEKIEKIFTLESKEASEKFKTLLREVPIEVMEVAEQIIHYAKTTFQKKLNDMIYVALTDHLHFAIERNQQGLDIKNALIWEIKKLYKDEFSIGQQALKIIKDHMKIELPEDEAGFIALHIVNAELNEEVPNLIRITKIIQQVLTLVKYHFNMEFDEDSLNYFRFVTHLKFFAQRLISNTYMEDGDDFLYQAIKEKHKKAFSCTEKIKDFFKKEYQHTLTHEEMLYLTIHIHRVVSR
jgi:beta-glucoside operon transcriptional antiterminator